MADLTHKAIEDLRAELEQQRARAEAAEHGLREMRKLVDAWKAADIASDEALDRWHEALKANGGLDPERDLHRTYATAAHAAAQALEAIRNA